MADGTEYTIDIPVNASGVASAAVQVALLADSLTGASAAADAAANAVTAGEAAFKQAENAANKAALAVEKIGIAADTQRGKLAKALEIGDVGAIERASAKLQDLNAKQAAAATKAAAATAAMNAQAVVVDKLEAKFQAAARGEDTLSKAFDKAKDAADRAGKASKAAAGSGKANEIGEGLAKLGGPLGAVGQKVFGVAEGFKKLSGSLGSAGPYVAIAVGLVAIAVGAVAAAAGVIAVTAAILKFAVANADAARTAGLLAVEAKGGAEGLRATALLALSLDSQAKKLKDSVGKIFTVSSGALERFLRGLSKIGDLFDENSASATAIRVVFQSVFDPLLDGITEFIPKAVSAFIQFEIMALKALIAIKPFGSTILMVAKVLGVVALVVGVVVVGAIALLAIGVAAMAVGFTALVVIVVAVIAGLVWLGSQFAALGAAIANGAGAGLDWLKGKFDEVVAFLQGLSFAEIGTNLIDGLVNGIMAAGPKVLSAITGLASGAINAAKKALGIASPSTVFAEIGMHTAAGMTEGVDGGADAVQGSMKELVAPPDAPAGAGGTATASAGGGGNVYHLYFQGGDAQSNRDAFVDFLESIGVQPGPEVG